MLQHIRAMLIRLRRDEGGNVFILFGACAIPLLLIMGGAIDISRYTRYKTDLSNAVDAAALALARQHQDYTELQATTFVANYVNSFQVGDSQFTVQDFSVTKLTNGFHVTANGEMKTIFLPLAQFAKFGQSISKMDMSIVSEVVNSSNRVELAFVFDNTGSMTDYAGSNACGSGSDKMAGLKCAAKTLVASLTADMNSSAGNPMLKMALVPFEGAVNTGVSASSPPFWVDWDANYGQAKYDGVNFDQKSSKNVSHRWLYNKLGITWAGCVEMRAEPYDLLDTTPTTSDPDTLFVPMFWPDEPDTSSSYWNNYLDDSVSSGSGGWGWGWGWGGGGSSYVSDEDRQKSLTKYDKSSPSQISWHSGKKDTTYPYDSGPNRGCPTPITPLTTSKSTIDSAIDAMQAQGATGTFIPAGLAWGWRVLSPTEPFTEGVGPSDQYYDTTVKAIVLMSDGANSASVNQSNGNFNQSTYSSYNYTATEVGGKYRLQYSSVSSPPSNSRANEVLNSKTSDLCDNVKAANIRLYTITFGTLDTTSKNLMTSCATVDSSGDPLYYHAPSSSELDSIFHAIGEDLSEIHLSM